jgi:streptogramin lyase
MAPGPDGNLWFTEYGGNNIGRITPSGVVTEFPVPTRQSEPLGIAPGPDGNLWFADAARNRVWRITTSGVMDDFRVPTQDAAPYDIAPGPDGNLWFTEFLGNNIGRITDRAVPTITLQPDAGPPGTVVQVSGSGFGSFEKVKLTFIDSVNGATSLGKSITDATGHFLRMVTIPANATPGAQTIKAKGLISGLHVTATFTVT